MLWVESLRSWVKQDVIDRGKTGGVTTVEAERIRELERENRELRRATPGGVVQSESLMCVVGSLVIGGND